MIVPSISEHIDYSFDLRLFVSRLKNACPDMAVYEGIETAESAEVEIHNLPPSISKL